VIEANRFRNQDLANIYRTRAFHFYAPLYSAEVKKIHL